MTTEIFVHDDASWATTDHDPEPRYAASSEVMDNYHLSLATAQDTCMSPTLREKIRKTRDRTEEIWDKGEQAVRDADRSQHHHEDISGQDSTFSASALPCNMHHYHARIIIGKLLIELIKLQIELIRIGA